MTQREGYISSYCFSRSAHLSCPSNSTRFISPKCSFILNFLFRTVSSLCDVSSMSESISTDCFVFGSIIQLMRFSSWNLLASSYFAFSSKLNPTVLLLKSSLLAKSRGRSASLSQFLSHFTSSAAYFSCSASLSLFVNILLLHPT